MREEGAVLFGVVLEASGDTDEELANAGVGRVEKIVVVDVEVLEKGESG